MSSRTPEDLKRMIIERANRMREEPAMEEVVVEDEVEEAPPEEYMEYEAEEGEEEDAFFDALDVVRQDGFADYIYTPDAENPYGPEHGLFMEAWEQGFYQAHQHARLAYLVTSLKDFFIAESDEEAEKAMDRVEEAYYGYIDTVSLEEFEDLINLIESQDAGAGLEE
jgi:hypothetical protein